MALPGNPLIVQGMLNRAINHVIVTDNPLLSVSASYMAKSMSALTFEDQFNDQIPTATGVVNSPMLYVQSQIVIGLLRSQPLAGLWLAQSQVNVVIGDVSIFSDSTLFPEIDLVNCSIMNIDPGAFDGNDPAVKVTIKGTFYVNASLWAAATVPQI